ncbi:MAG TPA: hypothetical protein VFG54_04045 [Prolixibacteraceae bacterium]|nr:hypothetical protein [Prolixibacteraceae bacterium]
MKTFNKLLLLLLVITLIGCEETIEPKVSNSNPLIGSWINPQSMDTLWRYERADALQDDCPGFTFKAEGWFVERKNAGWCGTPPITYANFNGTWTRNDSLIQITVDYWGGETDYQWRIISVDDHYLMLYKVKEEYRNR